MWQRPRAWGIALGFVLLAAAGSRSWARSCGATPCAPLMPSIVGASLAALDFLAESTALRDRVWENAARFREKMAAAGFRLKPGSHPIVPIMLGEAKLAVDFALDLLAEGIFVVGFSFPVVPRGEARIRVQLSAAHTPEMVDRAVAAFTAVVLIGGIRRIAAVCEWLVPFMAVFYVLGCAFMLAMNLRAIPGTIGLILSSAFTGQASCPGSACRAARCAAG